MAGSSNDGSRSPRRVRLQPGRGHYTHLNRSSNRGHRRTDPTDAGATHGGRWVSGCVHRGYDLRLQPATASCRAVRAWSVWLYGGAAKRGSAVETRRMSQVRTAILETNPSQWFSELLKTDGFRTRIPYVIGSRRSLQDTKHADEHGTAWERRCPELSGLTGRLEMRLRERVCLGGQQAVVKGGFVMRTCITTSRLASASVRVIGS